MKGTRDLLLATKPKLKKIEIDGADYFIRELTVGEVNEQIYGQQHRLMRIAKEQGIELNLENEEELTKQLTQIYDPYALSRTLAMRLCDEQGKNLFEPNNNADLEALSQLDNDIFKKLTDAIKSEEETKNSPPDASSN
ncbi:hypothetical protein C3007_07205 [Avibacterium gallinarum]|uniref:Uncharacterized protein n=1 Tax=Avibacterium gallinarum TaxID=755 RepID=A0A379AZW4_AVIGA|nr:hypothetical protein [Avibacterium gallinarum]POY44097.1 hypothetical protein C3007_07205 [Avibacterium gallinarum]TDP29099.1 hypothetical protein EV689_10315 [Avibacterium gallinarum]SUB28503.1 Uncharacterised protein [Avibacterium gallinarum]